LRNGKRNLKFWGLVLSLLGGEKGSKMHIARRKTEKFSAVFKPSRGGVGEKNCLEGGAKLKTQKGLGTQWPSTKEKRKRQSRSCLPAKRGMEKEGGW